MLAPLILTTNALYTMQEDATLVGVLASQPDDSGVTLKLNGNIIVQLATGGGTASTGATAVFIPLKISLKKGMTLQMNLSTCVLCLYFS